jgi:hypothetical protein
VLFEARDRVLLTRNSGLRSPEDLATLDKFVAGLVAREGCTKSTYGFIDVETFAIATRITK